METLWRRAVTRGDPTTALPACKCLPGEKTRSFRRFRGGEIGSFLHRPRERCQCVQRLLKTLHRDDPEAVRVLPRVAGVLPRGDEEGVHTRLARADRLLLDAADRAHLPVEEDLARGRDP